jgi:hypothetical protein
MIPSGSSARWQCRDFQTQTMLASLKLLWLPKHRLLPEMKSTFLSMNGMAPKSILRRHSFRFLMGEGIPSQRLPNSALASHLPLRHCLVGGDCSGVLDARPLDPRLSTLDSVVSYFSFPLSAFRPLSVIASLSF